MTPEGFPKERIFEILGIEDPGGIVILPCQIPEYASRMEPVYVLPGLRPLKRAPREIPPPFVYPPADLPSLLQELSSPGDWGLDIETQTRGEPDELSDELLGIGLCKIAGDTVRSWFIPAWQLGAAKDALRRLPPSYVWGGKYDVSCLRRYGIRTAIRGDGMICAYLLGEPNARLKAFVKRRWNLDLQEFTEVTGGLPASSVDLSSYCMRDAYWAIRSTQLLEGEIEDRGLREAYEQELRIQEILMDMQEKGIRFDRMQASLLLRQVRGELRDLASRLRKLAEEDGFFPESLPPRRCPSCRGGKKKRLSCDRCGGKGTFPRYRHFNPSSVQQAQRWLVGSGRLTPSRQTPRGAPMIAALDLLRSTDPACRLLLAYRAGDKLRQFIRQWNVESRKDGRLHSRFRNTHVVSGRLSSASPNLQQVKVEWRHLFLPDPGGVLLAGDYNQLEARIMAAVSGDPVMVRLFLEDGNLHAETTEAVFGIPSEKAKEHLALYTAGKSINFAVGYGAEASKLVEMIERRALENPELGIPVPDKRQAEAWLDAHRERYRGYWEWTRTYVEQCRDRGYSDTIFGHRRYLPGLLSSDPYERAEAERQAINHRIQGSAAGIAKKAMELAVLAGLDLRLQVHDELLCCTTDPERDSVLLQEAMSSAAVLSHGIPLVVDVAWGENWRDCHK